MDLLFQIHNDSTAHADDCKDVFCGSSNAADGVEGDKHCAGKDDQEHEIKTKLLDDIQAWCLQGSHKD